MAEELGRIERPEAAGVLGQRKLYVVALIQPMPDAPDGYGLRLSKYWNAVDDHVSRLEARAGLVKRIFHEGVGYSGQAAMDQLKQSNMPALPLINSRIEGGATFEAFDDDDLFRESIDWARCLQIGFTSRKVAETVSEAFNNATQQRFEHLANQLDEKLGAGEAGMLVMSNTRNLKLPEGVEVFNVMPPELDELTRWLDETLRSEMEAAVAAQQAASQAGGGKDEQEESPGLWTPG